MIPSEDRTSMHAAARAGRSGADCLQSALQDARRLPLRQRLTAFSDLLAHEIDDRARLYRRTILSPMGRTVLVEGPDGRARSMLMFGSNNYLGLANHPHVLGAVRRALQRWGAGVAGPPHLNGTLRIHRELEERLAAFKGQEDAVLFPTGYGANTGLVSALVRRSDRVVYDEKHHASFLDGRRLSGADGAAFRHNDLADLERILALPCAGDTLVGVESVYSMDGDLAPLDRITLLARSKGALVAVDDAHGTGVLGPGGRGGAAAFDVEGAVDAVMGTFSKTFTVTGGFVAGSRALVDWLRFYARSHMFSASLAPSVVAAVLAGLDVIENDPSPRERLWANVAHLDARLRQIGVRWGGASPICSLAVPLGVDVHGAAARFDAEGLFVNAIVYPAVPAGAERFRISLSAEHTADDIDRLVETFARISEHA